MDTDGTLRLRRGILTVIDLELPIADLESLIMKAALILIVLFISINRVNEGQIMRQIRREELVRVHSVKSARHVWSEESLKTKGVAVAETVLSAITPILVREESSDAAPNDEFLVGG